MAQKRAGYRGLTEDQIKLLEANWMPTDASFRFALGAEVDARAEVVGPLLPLDLESTPNALVFSDEFVLNSSTTENI